MPAQDQRTVTLPQTCVAHDSGATIARVIAAVQPFLAETPA